MKNNKFLQTTYNLNTLLSLLRLTTLNSEYNKSKLKLFKLSFFFILLLIFCSMNSQKIEQLDFFQIEKYSKDRNSLESSNLKPIQIKGFLYRSDLGQHILASEPNLKSCCVGSLSKRHKQLIVFGDIPTKYLELFTPVTLGGELVNADVSATLQLRNAKVIEDTNSDNTWIWILAFLGIALITYLTYRIYIR